MSFSHFLRAVRAIAQAPQAECLPLPSEPDAVENDYFRLARLPRTRAGRSRRAVASADQAPARCLSMGMMTVRNESVV